MLGSTKSLQSSALVHLTGEGEMYKFRQCGSSSNKWPKFKRLTILISSFDNILVSWSGFLESQPFCFMYMNTQKQ